MSVSESHLKQTEERKVAKSFIFKKMMKTGKISFLFLIKKQTMLFKHENFTVCCSTHKELHKTKVYQILQTDLNIFNIYITVSKLNGTKVKVCCRSFYSLLQVLSFRNNFLHPSIFQTRFVPFRVTAGAAEA